MFCTIQLSKSDPTPLYIQLGHELAKLIEGGILPNGTKLPTIRSLSRKLKINRDTVVSAYKFLESQELIVSHVGSGTYVAAPSSSYSMGPTSHITCSSLAFSKELFPISIAQNLAHTLLEREEWSCFSDPLYRERSLLKQSVCDFFKSVGVSPSPAEVRIVKDALSFLLHLIRLSPKNGICIEHFSDLSYSAFLKASGIKIYEIPLEKDGMNLEALEKQLKSHTISYIWVSSYIQNPTGICYSTQKKQALLELASKYDCYILEDGTLNDFVYHHFFLEPLYTMDKENRVIFLHHFSKLYLPELPYSFFILPPLLLKKIPDCLECTLNEHIFREYLESDTFNSLRQTILLDCFDKYSRFLLVLKKLNQHFDVYYQQGGLFFWINCPSDNMEKICNQLALNHIIVAPGTLFTNENTCDFLRISLSQLKNEDMDRLIDIFNTLY